MSLQEALNQLAARKDLSLSLAEEAMRQIMGGEATPAQIAAFMMGLRIKGETVPEIAGCAQAMRSCAERISLQTSNVVDTCGTGGDRSGTFNISTTTAFVVAGTGLTVAKHSNRSVSSNSGSADVLEALGVNLSLTPAQVETCINEVGIGFLFAPTFHRAMKYAAGPRRELGLRTIFNLLGPLTNPANTKYQVLGVYAKELTETIACTLAEIGVEGALVVHGHDGLDEVTLTAPTRVSALKNGKVETFDITPEELGFQRCQPEDLKGADPKENARITLDILTSREQGPKRHVVLANAAAALVAAGWAQDLPEGVMLAQEAIDSGSAYSKLQDLITFSQQAPQTGGESQ